MLHDKIHACWMGKNIGGTLGGPYEGKKVKQNVTEIPDLGGKGPLPNDDLDLQLLNLHAIEQRGLYLTTNDFSEEWAEHIYFQYDEYGYALTNIRKGMVYPFSGYYNNPFVNCMGSPIRSELWASIAPGRPTVAAYYAYQDAMVDHVGGEGVYGEIFFAALESLAYTETNLLTLIEEALKYLPADCRTAQAVRDTMVWYQSGVSYDDIREYILEKHGNANFTDAPQNIAFTMVGLLYAKDFGDCLLKTVNLGYDTDCTTATAGSIYGILHGTQGIPAEWARLADDRIVVSQEVVGCAPPKSIRELTERTVHIMKHLDLEEDRNFAIEWLSDYNQQIYTLPAGANAHSSLRICVSGEDGLLGINKSRKQLYAEISNNTCGAWRFYVCVTGKTTGEQFVSEAMELQPGAKTILPFQVFVAETENMTAGYTFSVIRTLAGEIWKKYDVNLVFPVASKWTVDGKAQYCEGGLVTLVGNGTHRAETRLTVPSARQIQLVCACTEPVKVWLDGKMIIENQTPTDYMPAYHRGCKALRAPMEIGAGEHHVVVEVESSQEDCRIMFLPVAPWNYYHFYFTDCLIGEA